MARLGYYGPGGMFEEVFRTLLGREDAPLVSDYREVEERLWQYSCTVWLPIMVGGNRAQKGFIYGRLIRAHELIISQTTTETTLFVCPSYGPLRAQAYIGGLLFLMWLDIKKEQREAAQAAGPDL